MTQNKLLALTALVLGLFALIAGTPRRHRPERIDLARLAGEIEREEDHVDAPELAAALMAHEHQFTLYDLRDKASFEAYHLPGAVRADFDSLLAAPINPADSLILYSEGGTHASQAWVMLRVVGYKKIRTLKNGLNAWNDEILHPIVAAGTDSSLLASVRARAEFFGGSVIVQHPAVAANSGSPKSKAKPDLKKPVQPANNMREEERPREGC